MGDVGMFGESECAILFNPWDDRPRDHAHHVIEEKDLTVVLDLICERFSLQNLDARTGQPTFMVDDLMSICPHCGFLLGVFIPGMPCPMCGETLL